MTFLSQLQNDQRQHEVTDKDGELVHKYWNTKGEEVEIETESLTCLDMRGLGLVTLDPAPVPCYMNRVW